MTTPLCNDGCTDSVGWLPETSWPYSVTSKTSAQSIYCLSGLPKVPPRGLFVADYADARQDSSGSGRALGASGAIGSGAYTSVDTSLVVSNTTAYNMDVFGMWTGNAVMSIVTDAVYKFTTSVYKDGTLVSSATDYEYGTNSVSVSGWRQMKNYAFKFLGTLAPATSATFTIKTTWVKESGTTSASNVMNSFTSALRVFTGNS